MRYRLLRVPLEWDIHCYRVRYSEISIAEGSVRVGVHYECEKVEERYKAWAKITKGTSQIKTCVNTTGGWWGGGEGRGGGGRGEGGRWGGAGERYSFLSLLKGRQSRLRWCEREKTESGKRFFLNQGILCFARLPACQNLIIHMENTDVFTLKSI